MNKPARYAPRVDRSLVEAIKRIEEKWAKKWSQDKLFEADPDPSRPKYFVTFPYPYVNSYPHLGSAFTILRVDILARFKRMRGFNVLFAQGWHATGGPIVASALRLREGDPKIVETLREIGVRDEELPKFKEPQYWIRFFIKGWREDLARYGMSIDWRREFHTTSLNPYYSKFIEWQVLKLREKGLISKGSHPVVWCPKESKVVGDHDRPDEYAGISPQAAVIIKFRTEDGLVLPALTYRPETVYGAVNVWVRASYTYLIAEVDGETWVINEYAVKELEGQGFEVKITGNIRGSELVGRWVVNPATGTKIPVLPAEFVDPDIGTGIVMSVPAHAPYDYVALMDLKKDPNVLKAFNTDPSIVSGIEPVGIISVEGYSEVPARDAVEKRRIKSQHDRSLLEDATKEVYSKEYHSGVMKEGLGPWGGMPVSKAKEKITEFLAEKGFAIRIYTLPEPVYCRCGSRTHVKIVKDQWFLKYSDARWKKLAHKAVDSMSFYPEDLRKHFHSMIDWYDDWAFTHKGELGTKLPWNPEWVIESLSDSTIYMAYYAVAKYLEKGRSGVKPEQLSPEVFDYIFLGRGDPGQISSTTGIPIELLRAMREEFEYWYPVDMRISGKDLLPNHLVFYIFHHVAIFSKDKWPKGIGINGWVLIGGEKMSKSKGNFILLRQALDWWGASATRWAEVMAGADPGLDDANFEPSVADKAVEELLSWIRFAEENYGKGRTHRKRIDAWFESVLNKTIRKVTELMEEQKFKTALVEGYYNLQSAYKWYIKRAGEPQRDVLARFIEVQTLILAPFVPHVADEVWERIGKKGYASTHAWPESDRAKISDELERSEEIIKTVIQDSLEIMRFVRRPGRARIIVAAGWKYRLLEDIKKHREKGLNLREAISRAVRESTGGKKEAGRIASLVARKPEVLSLLVPRNVEIEALNDARDLIREELGVEVIVETEEQSRSPKRTQALPAKPAIHIEEIEE
ncbi:MAG: leucine--tRNA ligase [Desulfurococcales archaeon]|nr:leucine--tRNA ligase [Desulfurococcales archaeon]